VSHDSCQVQDVGQLLLRLDLILRFILLSGGQEVMMDYALQTISYIADIDDILILMVRQSLVVGSPADGASDAAGQKRQVKICCHVFESDEVSSSTWQCFI